MDLSTLSATDLRALQEEIKLELKKRGNLEIVDARNKIMAIAQSVGLPLKDLIGAGTRAKSGPVAAQYRNPADTTQTWSGRGRQPKWVKEWVNAGKSLDAIRV